MQALAASLEHAVAQSRTLVEDSDITVLLAKSELERSIKGALDVGVALASEEDPTLRVEIAKEDLCDAIAAVGVR